MIVKVPLSRGYVAVIDKRDARRVLAFKWCSYTSPCGIVYAVRRSVRSDGGQTTQRMHRFIMGVTDRLTDVDHRDGDGLNNRRKNLRAGTRSQNLGNQRKARGTSKYKGVYWDKRDKKWNMTCGSGERRTRKAYFSSEAETARAYDAAAVRLWGSFARLNFPKATP